jgi:hypothetical protein
MKKRLAFFLVGILFLTGCPPCPTVVWPLSGTESPDGPLSSAFGPRLKTSEDGRYDFHRGIDLPAPEGSPVHAIAAGTVRIAGEDPSYSDLIVQITHSHEDGTPYYSNYIHLSEVLVSEGALVRVGELIGRTGVGASGFPHLHFETRDLDLFQRNCVNPFSLLPYGDVSSPGVVIDSVAVSAPRNPVVTVTVTLPREGPTGELDFNAVTVSVFASGAGEAVDVRRYDMTEWNLAYTPLPPDDANINMDAPDFNGMHIAPSSFGTDSELYQVQLIFNDLSGPDDVTGLVVRVSAEDVKGNTSQTEYIHE